MFSKKTSNYRKNSLDGDIHYFFIFNPSGTSFYSRKYTEQYKLKANLLGGFCIALMNLSVDIIGNKIKILDMENVRLVLIEKGRFFYAFLVESNFSTSFLEKICFGIEKVLLLFLRNKKLNPEVRQISDKEFDHKIDKVIFSIKQSFLI
jgi:hypothetical protein